MKPFTMLILFALFSCAPSITGKQAPPDQLYMETIVEFPGRLQPDIYNQTYSWFVEVFNNASSVIEYSDKEAGRIAGKYVFSFSDNTYGYDIRQAIIIDVKDQKIRVRFSDPYYRLASGLGLASYNDTSYKKLTHQNGVTRTRNEWKSLVTSLTTYIKNNKSSDW